MPKILIVCLKLILALGLLTFLVFRALNGSQLSSLKISDLNISFLLLGLFFNFLATLITILRWKALVIAIGGSLSTLVALKVGFIGFMFNLSPVGIVGGDAIKIALLTKAYKVSLDKSTASAIVDRVIGLLAMFVLGVIIVFATQFNKRPETVAQIATQGLIFLTIGASLFFVFTLAPASSKDRRVALISKLPFIGKPVAKIVKALQLYSAHKKTLFLSFLATLLVHALFSASLYCLARGIFNLTPSFIDHVILYCTGNVGSLIPLSAGPLEYFLDELYPLFTIPGRANYELGCGMAIGVAYRLVTIVVALLGLFFYIFSSSNIKQTLKDVSKS